MGPAIARLLGLRGGFSILIVRIGLRNDGVAIDGHVVPAGSLCQGELQQRLALSWRAASEAQHVMDPQPLAPGASGPSYRSAAAAECQQPACACLVAEDEDQDADRAQPQETPGSARIAQIMMASLGVFVRQAKGLRAELSRGTGLAGAAALTAPSCGCCRCWPPTRCSPEVAGNCSCPAQHQGAGGLGLSQAGTSPPAARRSPGPRPRPSRPVTARGLPLPCRAVSPR